MILLLFSFNKNEIPFFDVGIFDGKLRIVLLRIFLLVENVVFSSSFADHFEFPKNFYLILVVINGLFEVEIGQVGFHGVNQTERRGLSGL